MAMSELKQQLLKIAFAQLGFHDARYYPERGVFVLDPSDERLAKIYDSGNIHSCGEYDHLVRHDIEPVVKMINEQVATWERAPLAPFKDLSNYRILNEYNNVVLAARDDSSLGYGHGLHFTTWEYACNREGFLYGHYTTDYENAKEDFAIRAGLINRYKMFDETELKLLRQGLVHLGADYPDLTVEQMTNVGRLIEKIGIIVPEIRGHEELEHNELVPDDGLEI